MSPAPPFLVSLPVEVLCKPSRLSSGVECSTKLPLITLARSMSFPSLCWLHPGLFLSLFQHILPCHISVCVLVSILSPREVIRTRKSNILSNVVLSCTAFSIAFNNAQYLFNILRMCLGFSPIFPSILHPYRHTWSILMATIHPRSVPLADHHAAILPWENWPWCN